MTGTTETGDRATERAVGETDRRRETDTASDVYSVLLVLLLRPVARSLGRSVSSFRAVGVQLGCGPSVGGAGRRGHSGHARMPASGRQSPSSRPKSPSSGRPKPRTARSGGLPRQGGGRVEAVVTSPPLEVPPAHEIAAVFRRLDARGRGALSIGEVDRAVAELYGGQGSVCRPALHRSFHAADATGGGAL